MKNLTYGLSQTICLLVLSFSCLAQTADGPLVVSQNGHWFEYRDSGKPFFMAGSGGPEGFFYETDARKQTIVDDLIRTGANAIYVHSIRSFEGDGFDYEDPFNINENINSGVDDTVLNNWLGYLSELDDNKIVTWFHIIDDTARPWGCINNISELPQTAKDYVETIVKKFRDLDHLVWLSGEEYLMGRCTKAQDDTLMSAIAAEIKKHDPVHPIGVHHNNGQAMQFGDDPNVNVFAQQICGNSSVRNPNGIHNSASFNDAWVYVMSECHPWHRDLIERRNTTAEESRELLRLSNWATALAGGYVLMYDAYECPNKQCTRNSQGEVILQPDAQGDVRVTNQDPSENMLRDMTRLHQFMTASDFHLLTPNDSLAAGNTLWVMANAGSETYIAYSNNAPGTMGVQGLFPDGIYNLRWFNPQTGAQLNQQLRGDQSPFSVPAQFGKEVALSIKPDGAGGNRAPIANTDNYDVLPNNDLSVNVTNGVLANDTDFENSALTASLLTTTRNGQLTLNNNGSFTYQPNTNFEGQDSFSYRANDGSANSNAAMANINVSDTPPVVLWLINATTNQRVRRLVNNELINLNNLGFSSFSIEAEVNNVGSVVMVYSGIVNGRQTEGVTPYAMFGDSGGNFTGMRLAAGSLTINATAYSGGSGSGTVIAQSNLTVSFSDTVPNRAPIARPDVFYVLQNTVLAVSRGTGVLVNDSDADGDALTAERVGNVSNGDLNFNINGGFRYQPNPSFLGADSFTYRASDGSLDSSTVRATIKVVDELPAADESLCLPIKSTKGAVSLVCL